MEPIGVRMNALKEFLADCDPSKEAFIVPIVDMFGPTITGQSLSHEIFRLTFTMHFCYVC